MPVVKGSKSRGSSSSRAAASPQSPMRLSATSAHSGVGYKSAANARVTPSRRPVPRGTLIRPNFVRCDRRHAPTLNQNTANTTEDIWAVPESPDLSRQHQIINSPVTDQRIPDPSAPQSPVSPRNNPPRDPEALDSLADRDLWVRGSNFAGFHTRRPLSPLSLLDFTLSDLEAPNGDHVALYSLPTGRPTLPPLRDVLDDNCEPPNYDRITLPPLRHYFPDPLLTDRPTLLPLSDMLRNDSDASYNESVELPPIARTLCGPFHPLPTQPPIPGHQELEARFAPPPSSPEPIRLMRRFVVPDFRERSPWDEGVREPSMQPDEILQAPWYTVFYVEGQGRWEYHLEYPGDTSSR